MFKQISILAPGLLGASIGRAVKARGLSSHVRVWARRPDIRVALEASDWCDSVAATASAGVEGADLVVVCTPVEVIAPLVKEFRGSLSAGAIVTDVGSTKSLVCRLSHAAMPEGIYFVGSHPMAGSEKSGMEHADAELFQGRACFVTPLEQTNESAIVDVCRFWRNLGMEVTTFSPEQHDEIVAHISHVPHVLASALCLQLQEKNAGWEAFAGGGLRDTTRVAAGLPGLWTSIIEQNDAEILRAMHGLEVQLQQFQSAIQNKEWHRLRHLLERGKQFRERL